MCNRVSLLPLLRDLVLAVCEVWPFVCSDLASICNNVFVKRKQIEKFNERSLTIPLVYIRRHNCRHLQTNHTQYLISTLIQIVNLKAPTNQYTCRYSTTSWHYSLTAVHDDLFIICNCSNNCSNNVRENGTQISG